MAMWNDAFIVRQSENFARLLRSKCTETEDHVRLAFRLALSREPSTEELQDFTAYVDKHGLENFCRVVFNLNEFIFVN